MPEGLRLDSNTLHRELEVSMGHVTDPGDSRIGGVMDRKDPRVQPLA
jgi:hypothetical protein